MLSEAFLLITTIVVISYLYTKKLCRDFDVVGIRYVKPWPIFGNLLGVLLGREHLATMIENITKKYPDDRYIGMFNFMVPMIMVQDPELIQDITIKNFAHFAEHTIHLSNDVEPLFGRTLVNLRGQKWRDMRATLSPAFTSSKMRNMYGFMTDCAVRMIAYYEDICKKNLDNNGEATVVLEARDMVTRYNTDVIASAAFGIEVNTLVERDNQFFKMGQVVSNMTPSKFLGFCTYPKLMKMLGITLLPENSTIFFKKLLKETTQQREEHNIYRPDMIHLLMQAKKGTLRNDDDKQDTDDIGKVREGKPSSFTDEDFAAQAMFFFLAGFEAASVTSNFLFFSFINSPEVQKKLYQEVVATRKQHNDVITYEVIHSMKYLDMVISEMLRRWPSGSAYTDRSCVKEYILPPARDGLPEYKLKKGFGVWIPISSIHMNPKYWSEPEKFDPERFSEENKTKITPFAYIPFGMGPRVCIGNRFALMELKVLAFYIVNNFEVLECTRTQKKLVLDTASFNVRIKGGLWIKLKTRNM